MKDGGGNLGTLEVWRLFAPSSFQRQISVPGLTVMVNVFCERQFIEICNCSPVPAATFSLLQFKELSDIFSLLVPLKLVAKIPRQKGMASSPAKHAPHWETSDCTSNLPGFCGLLSVRILMSKNSLNKNTKTQPQLPAQAGCVFVPGSSSEDD